MNTQLQQILEESLHAEQYGIEVGKQLVCDVGLMICLIKHSLSLDSVEKANTILALPQLTQWQLDELLRIFWEEQEKFAAVGDSNEDHAEQLAHLRRRVDESWKVTEAVIHQVRVGQGTATSFQGVPLRTPEWPADQECTAH